jgi:voltage-dependent potassium channel beta subunit
MEYRKLGGTGLRVSALSLGGWLTFGERLDDAASGAIIRCAVEHGVNFIDVADSYGRGAAERAVGVSIGGIRRAELVLSSKVFWPMSDDPNDRGLSRKHIMESIDRTLRNLRTDYLDLYFCHRHDPETPLEETVRAMDDLVCRGKVLYWGTSVWNQRVLHRAQGLARRRNLTAPVVEQPCYNLLSRDIERWLMPTTIRHRMGLVVWSPLAGGLLTGKYANGIPAESRARASPVFLRESEVTAQADRVRRFCEIATGLGCSPAQLAIAWVLRRPFVSSVITGATSTAQLLENLRAAEVTIPEGVLVELERLFPSPRIKPGDIVRLASLAWRPRALRKLLKGG